MDQARPIGMRGPYTEPVSLAARDSALSTTSPMGRPQPRPRAAWPITLTIPLIPMPHTTSSLSSLSGAVLPFDAGQSHFILLNLAVGGSWPVSPDGTTP